MILTIDTVIDGEDTRHRSSGYESSGDSGATLLSGDSLLHQSNVAFLLLIGTTLGAEGGFQDMMQLDLIGNAIFCIKHMEAMYLHRYTRVV